jgi:hypothetical protein
MLLHLLQLFFVNCFLFVNLFSASSCVTAIATASSEYLKGGTRFEPQLAIDGKIAKGGYDYFHSDHDVLQPWLQIAFPNVIQISRVVITNR